MTVELHIERLVLQGFRESDGPAVAAALRDHLGALLAGAPVAWASRSHVDAGQFLPGTSAGETGARLATAVHEGLSR